MRSIPDQVIEFSVWTTEEWEFESLYDQEFSLLLVMKIGSGTHPASCPMGTGGIFAGG
jgi:hypothetical protein